MVFHSYFQKEGADREIRKKVILVGSEGSSKSRFERLLTILLSGVIAQTMQSGKDPGTRTRRLGQVSAHKNVLP